MAVLAFCRPAAAESLIALAGNRPASAQGSDWKELAAATPLRMEAVLTLRNRDELSQLETDLEDRSSPRYHRWLTSAQFANRFGPDAAQMRDVEAWLTSSGLIVTSSDIGSRTVKFKGTYAAVSQALQTTIRTDGIHFANVTDPMIPASLSGTVQAIFGLNGLVNNKPSGITDGLIGGVSGTYFAAADLYTFYDENPVIAAGNHGTSAPDCIALPELASVNQNVFAMFTNQFHLPPIDLQIIHVDGAHPGLPTDNEPYLDVEWTHAVSPNTPIVMYVADSYEDALQQAVSDNRCGVISSSVEDTCPTVAQIMANDEIAAQGVSQGQTIFHSSGDYGASWECGSPVPNDLPTVCHGLYEPSVDEEAAGPNVTSVGGTQFVPVYDSDGNDISTIDDNLEEAWNSANITLPVKPPKDNCPIKDASGGGMSSVFAKPAWQSGPGVPADGVRDVPDISMGANGQTADDGQGYPAFWVATQKDTDPKPVWVSTGGTSIATPMWAGISRLLAISQGVARMGNVNPRLYELGSLASPDSGLHDVTVGDNGNNGVIGYSAGPGFDLVTGWGSPDIAKLVAAFPGASTTAAQVSITIAAGASAGAGSFTVTNTTANALQIGSVTIAISRPSFFSALALSATVSDGPPVTVTASPTATTKFTFDPAVAIPSGSSALFALQVTAASHNPASAGSIVLPDSASPGTGSFPGTVAIVIVMSMVLLIANTRRRQYALFAGMMLYCGAALLIASCSGGSSIATAPPSTTSRQSIQTGGISIGDGNGGIVETSGLPADLSTIKVKF